MSLSIYYWSMAAMLRDSTAVAVVVVVVRTRPRAIPLAMVHMRKSFHGFPSVPLYGYGAPLGDLRPPELRYQNATQLGACQPCSKEKLCCLTRFVKSRGLHIAAIVAAKCYTGGIGLFVFFLGGGVGGERY